jgi:alpha-L-arabinofuranosidase
VPLLFVEATRGSASGIIYLKVVNRAATAQAVHVTLTGVKAVKPEGKAIALAAASPDDSNSITEPQKIVPVTSKVEGLETNFTRSFPPHSITVLEIL